MIADGLVSVLNGLTDIPFEEIAWSEAPETKYGVVTVDGQSEFKADANPVAEKMRTGYVDVFVKPTDTDPTDTVEAAMNALDLWFRMESIQYEPETGFLHFEWRWTDTVNNMAKRINLDELPIMLHVTGTEQVVTANHTYRNVIFAAGETDKIYANRNTRDMYFELPAWNAGNQTTNVCLRKESATTDASNTTVVEFVCVSPFYSGNDETETVAGIRGYRVAVFFANGVFHSAIATYFAREF